MAFLQSIKRIATSFAVLLYASEIVRSNVMIVWKEILASIKSGSYRIPYSEMKEAGHYMGGDL